MSGTADPSSGNALYADTTGSEETPEVEETGNDLGVTQVGGTGTANSETSSVATSSSAPVITITSYTRSRISKQSGVDVCIVKFTSDQDLIAWEARADGYSAGTGDLVGEDEGSATTKGASLIMGRARRGRYVVSSPAGSSTGVLLTAGDVGQFEVEPDELTSGDKEYRITVYGKNLAGEWSDYGN